MQSLSVLAASFVMHYGYMGLFVTLVINCMGIPIASEITLPLAGIAARNGHLNLVVVMVVAVVGQVIGLSLSYLLARKDGLPLLERYGKYVFIRKHHIQSAQKLFKREGGRIVLAGLLLPGVHGYMGYSAGLEKIKFHHFVFLATIGSFLWAVVLVGLGYVAGGHLATIEQAFSGLGTLVIMGLVTVGVIWYSRRHWVHKARPARSSR